MKTTRLIAVLVGFAAIIAFTADASAYYHPTMGRFMQRDPGAGGAMRIGAGGAAPVGSFIPRDPTGTNQYADGMNLYEYVKSAPIKYVDPDGARPVIPGPNGEPMDIPSPEPDPDTDPPRLDLPPGASPLGDIRFVYWYCNKWIREESSNTGWLTNLPACPCTASEVRSASGAWTSLAKADQTYHPGACECTRSKNNDGGPGQQCCYDSNGKLITGGAGAGTPDKVGPEGPIDVLRHYFADVKMFSYCKAKLGDQWIINQYNRVRPPNNANNCAKNLGNSP